MEQINLTNIVVDICYKLYDQKEEVDEVSDQLKKIS